MHNLHPAPRTSTVHQVAMEYTDYPSFPILASTDCSPTMETFSYPTTFDKVSFTDPFTGLDTSLTNFDAYFGRPVSSADATQGLDATSPAAPTATQLKAPSNPAPVQHQFDQLNVFSSDYPWDTKPVPTTTKLHLSDDSQTPSLCGDGPQNPTTAASPPLSPESQYRRDSTNSLLRFEDPSNPPKRRRGRPRLDRSSSSLSSTSAKTQRTQRLPHNQVERKYREGLNATLERLRQTVPALCQEDKFGGIVGQPKPSKAMILEGAIEYIKEVERERDACRGENERLRCLNGGWEGVGQ